MIFFEGQFVYCIDEESPFYAKRFKVAVVLESGRPLLVDAATGESVRIRPEQVSDKKPDFKG